MNKTVTKIDVMIQRVRDDMVAAVPFAEGMGHFLDLVKEVMKEIKELKLTGKKRFTGTGKF
jgi:succinate dehydrogenase/fumarate reductase flavoprotein subunit